MTRKIKLMLRDMRKELPDAQDAAERDVEAGVPRDVGERRHVAAVCGVEPADFDPVNNQRDQRTAADMARLRSQAEELAGDVQVDEERVVELPAHPVVWYLAIAIMLPIEFIGGLKLFGDMGYSPGLRAAFATGLMIGTFMVVWVLRQTVADAAAQTGWRKLLGWATVCLTVVGAAVVAAAIAFARVDPGGSAGLPVVPRISRLAVTVFVTLLPALGLKYAVDRLGELRGPRRKLKLHRRRLKDTLAKLKRLEKYCDAKHTAADDWRAAAATERANYTAAYDRAAGSNRGALGGPQDDDDEPKKGKK